jgi:hypothetical protein
MGPASFRVELTRAMIMRAGKAAPALLTNEQPESVAVLQKAPLTAAPRGDQTGKD